MNTLIDDKLKNALLELLKDTESWNALESKIKNPNIFDILKISKMEIRHSNILAWLLNPNENHGIGDAFLQEFVAQIESMDNDLLLNFLMADLYSFQVYREYRFDSCPVDILLVSEMHKLVLAIENKLFSTEHKAGKKSDESQLQAYKKGITNQYPGYNCAYVFLTPDGCLPSDEEWLVLEYESVLKALEKVYSSTESQLKEEIRILINNYMEILKKEIIMDRELEKLCKSIYNKHRDALDLLFENRDDPTKRASDECRSVLEEKERDGILTLESSNKKSTIRFWTSNLKDHFKDCKEWIENENFFYQVVIKPQDSTVNMTLELVFHKEKITKLDLSIKEKIKGTIQGSTNKGNKKIERIEKDEWEWLRAWGTTFDPKKVFKNNDGLNDISKNDISTWLDNNLPKLPLWNNASATRK